MAVPGALAELDEIAAHDLPGVCVVLKHAHAVAAHDGERLSVPHQNTDHRGLRHERADAHIHLAEFLGGNRRLVEARPVEIIDRLNPRAGRLIDKHPRIGRQIAAL